jgi:predicted DNA-binding protein (UPF0251 family)
MDIFKKTLWYTYKENRSKWFKLSLEQVLEIIELNKNNEVAIPLEEYESEIEEVLTVDFENVVGQDSLTRFDVPKKRRRRNRNNNRKKVATGAKPAHAKRQQKPKSSGQSISKSSSSRDQKRNSSQNKPQNKRRRKPKPNGNSNQQQ